MVRSSLRRPALREDETQLTNRAPGERSVAGFVKRSSFWRPSLPQKVRQLGDVGGDAPWLDISLLRSPPAGCSSLTTRGPDVLQLHQKRKHSVRQVLQRLEMCLQLLPEQFGQVAVLCCLFVRRILGFRLARWTSLA